MGEVLIKAENVSKKFAKDFKKSLYYGLVDVFSSVFRKKQNKGLRKDEFWAVQNISFEVRRGECLGLIGHNGAGKSTLLKILNGLIAPDDGSITMYGKVGALIELGAGFNPILSGRENIYNNAAIIGFTKNEIDAKLQDIIDFAEIEEFIDMPVQNYSSGMKVRLGFAVAAQMEPDVLIVDEVLAVGDLGFILKCFKQIDTILPNTAVIFVSHNMPMVSRICNEIILMDHGKVEYQGNNVAKGIELYYDKFSNNNSNEVFSDQSMKLIEFTSNLENKSIKRNQNLELNLRFEIDNSKLKSMPKINIEIKDKDLRPIAGVQSKNLEPINVNTKELFFKFEIKNSLFTLGKYNVDLIIKDANTESPILRINNLAEFICEGEKSLWVPIELETDVNVIQN